MHLSWYDTVSFKIAQELTWDLFKDLLSKESWVVLELGEWYKLDDIARHVFLILLGIKWIIISIKNIHRCEISFSNSNNNNRKWKSWSSNNLIYCLFHIIDDTISQNQQDLIFLVVLCHLVSFCHIVYKFDNFVEMSWSVEVNIVQSLPVWFEDSIDTITLRVADVSI